MSRLNSSIKLAVMLGNLFFTLVSGVFAYFSGGIISGNMVAFNFDEARETAMFVFGASIAVLLFTCLGCCGAVNQVVRKGFCRGRSILSTHQLLLIGVLMITVTQSSKWTKREKSINIVLSDIKNYPNYDQFEEQISEYFNAAYFEGNCEENPNDSWMVQWVSENCPSTMAQKQCNLSFLERYTCDTSCDEPIWTAFKCCPSELQCDEGYIETCPYHQCRLRALTTVQSWLSPFRKSLQFVAILSATMIVLTCLLICYNPRDDLEDELLKTGVMTENDIAAMKKMRSSSKLSRSSMKSSIKIIDEDDERNDEVITICHPSKARRTRSVRISPTQ